MQSTDTLLTADVSATKPTGWHRLSLGTRLILVVVASLLPLIAFVLTRQYFDYHDKITKSAQDSLALTRSISLAVAGELNSRIAALQVLSQSRRLSEGDLVDFRTRAEAVTARQFPGSFILLLKPDGQQLVNTRLPPDAPLRRRRNLQWTAQVFATGEPMVSDVFIGAVSGGPSVDIDVPVMGPDGKVGLVLSMNPRLDAFASVITRAAIPENWVMSVFDRQGVTVARSLNPEQYVGQKGGSGLLEHMLVEPEGTFLSPSREGIEVVAAFTHVAPFGWAVAMGVPLAELSKPTAQAAVRDLVAVAAALLIGLTLALMVSRQITGPMTMLRRLANAADRRIVLEPPATGLREADEVAQALSLAEQQRNRSEAEVRDRTAQIEAVNKSLEAEVVVRRQAEQKAQAQLERLNLLQQITRAIGERQDLNSIFQVAVRSLEDQLPVDFACLCLYDKVDQALTVARVGMKSSALAFELAMPERARIDIDGNGLSRCVRGHVVYEPDIEHVDYPFPKRLARGSLRSLVVAPLQVESQVFGVLVTARIQANSFSSGECEFLRQLSEHVALASHQAQLYGALQSAYDDLRQTQQAMMQQERLRALGQMAGGIAHDINNALTPVALYIDTMLQGDAGLSEQARGYLEIVQRAVDDVAHTVSRMREFYRQREPQLNLASIDLNDLVPQVMDLTRARWNDMPMQRGTVVRLRTELAGDLPKVMGVEAEVREALINLILNSVDALPSGGTIIIRTSTASGERAGGAKVEVMDDGVGMEEEARRRCLEPFFTTKGERGTGLGLAMVYGVVQRHGGEVDIESKPGKGTTVRLSFPPGAATKDSTEAPTTVVTVPRRLRLLVVDDDPLVLRSLCHILENDGHVVVTAGGGEAGIAAFRAALERGEKFAAVITDLGMPNIDGRRVAAAIKEMSPTTPIILLTGWGERLLADEGIPQHVDCVLGKPPKLREVRGALAEHCAAA